MSKKKQLNDYKVTTKFLKENCVIFKNKNFQHASAIFILFHFFVDHLKY